MVQLFCALEYPPVWNWLPACLLVVGGLLVSAAVTVMPRDPHRLAAVYPPWWSAEAQLAAASRAGSVIAVAGFPFIVSVHSADSGLAASLHATGAWYVIDGSNFPLCGS